MTTKGIGFLCLAGTCGGLAVGYPIGQNSAPVKLQAKPLTWSELIEGMEHLTETIDQEMQKLPKFQELQKKKRERWEERRSQGLEINRQIERDRGEREALPVLPTWEEMERRAKEQHKKDMQNLKKLRGSWDGGGFEQEAPQEIKEAIDRITKAHTWTPKL